MNGLRYCIAAVIASLTALCASCALLGVGLPKEYVPDEKVVYLKQRVDLDPIRYEGIATDPYSWPVPSFTVNRERPGFLSVGGFSDLARPDYIGDARLYTEARAHFDYILSHPLFTELKKKIENAKIDPPKPYPSEKGDVVKEYTNATEYAYPKYENAIITIFAGGDYKIAFADKSEFHYFRDGSYRLETADKKIIFQVWQNGEVYDVTIDGYFYSVQQNVRKITSDRGSVAIHKGEEPQIEFKFVNSSDTYIFFIGTAVPYREYTLVRGNGLRYDYMPENKLLLVTSGTQALTISGDNVKFQSYFDKPSRSTKGLVSWYYPEGIRLANLDSNDISYSDVAPLWPEKYRSKAIGPFMVLYAAADEKLLERLNAGKLSEIDSFCGKATGIRPAGRRTIVIPPDLNSYRKLHSTVPREVMNWYPSGFQMKDIVVMWPISVPRYKSSAGQDYFFDVEFYEILAHEYTHLIVGEASGILNPVPVWLNEGLALYVETRYSEEARRYWDVTFEASRKLGRLLPWDDITERGTGDYPVNLARVHYAQSYAATKALIEKYGISRVTAYVRSFRARNDDLSKPLEVKIRETYKNNFKKIFGEEWNGDGLVAEKNSQ
jgi:hypothetical protein